MAINPDAKSEVVGSVPVITNKKSIYVLGKYSQQKKKLKLIKYLFQIFL